MTLQKKLEETKKQIKSIYLSCNLPWVIGYSGGKDSSCTVQLIWKALSELKPEERRNKVYIIFSDTFVEAPVISNYLLNITKKMNQVAQKSKLPVSVHGVFPKLDDSFWVNLLGRGYPAPTSRFRWCTDRMKIKPANQFILDVVSKYGEAIIVLGARSDESGTRAQVMKKAQDNIEAGAILPKSNTLPNAYVFTPIANWTVSDVWEYLLLHNKTPWKTSNRDLAAMYKNSTAGECPLVVDKNTPSCGNSRFGCWTCTVVESDNSLGNMIDNGAEWLVPLLEFRNKLKETTDPSKKHHYRTYIRRRGQVSFKNNTDDVEIIRGPYKVKIKRQFLRKLLEVQEEINQNKPDDISLELIRADELRQIRKIWITEDNDWEDNVSKIYKEIVGKILPVDEDDCVHFGGKEYILLDQICRDNNVPTELVAQLLDKEKEFSALGRRSTLNKELDAILRKEWRSEKEVLDVKREKIKNEVQ